jgi:hypothetical protein
MHTGKFIESASGKALLIAFNYDTEPPTGRFPYRTGLPVLRPGLTQSVGSR